MPVYVDTQYGGRFKFISKNRKFIILKGVDEWSKKVTAYVPKSEFYKNFKEVL